MNSRHAGLNCAHCDAGSEATLTDLSGRRAAPYSADDDFDADSKRLLPGATGYRPVIHHDPNAPEPATACTPALPALGSAAMRHGPRICTNLADRQRLPWRFFACRAGMVRVG